MSLLRWFQLMSIVVKFTLELAIVQVVDHLFGLGLHARGVVRRVRIVPGISAAEVTSKV